MAPKGSTYKRCGCKDPTTGKPLNTRCPQLRSRGHGTWTLDVRLDTTETKGRRLKRAGFEKKADADAALDHIRDLVKLAEDDVRSRKKIGDWIFTASKRAGQLPSVAEVRRRLGVGVDLAAAPVTVGEWLEEWFASKKDLEISTLNGYRHHIDKFLIPLLGELPRDKLTVAHIAGMFDRVAEWNEEVLAARKEGRPYDLPDDVRKNKHVVGVNTWHRILATLRSAYSDAVAAPGMLAWNPAAAIRLPPAKRSARRVWGPEQVAQFLAHALADRIGLLYRIVLLRGLRRGEAVGLRWSDLDDDLGGATIRHTILEVSGKLIEGTPKTAAGNRWVAFDPDTTEALKELRKTRRREKFAAGSAWDEHDLVWCREDGTPLRPSYVSLHFQTLGTEAGLPVITLHEGRHTAATLGLEGGVDLKVVSEQLGHASVSTTADLYQHVRKVVQKNAAVQLVQLLPETKAAGS